MDRGIGCLSLNDKEIDNLQTIKLAMKPEEKDIKMAAHNERFHASGGGMPADSFVRIWKFIARPNLCEPPACVKPPPRWRQCTGDT